MPTQLYVSLQGDTPSAASTWTRRRAASRRLKTSPFPAVLRPWRSIRTGQFLHVGRRGVCEVSSFRIDPHTGGLTLIGAIPLDAEPCYLAMDRQGRFLFSAYYAAGKAAVHAIDGNGAVGVPPVEWLEYRHRRACPADGPEQSVRLRAAHRRQRPQRHLPVPLRRAVGAHLTPNTPARLSTARAGGTPALLFSSPQGHRVFFQRAGLQRHRLRSRLRRRAR